MVGRAGHSAWSQAELAAAATAFKLKILTSLGASPSSPGVSLNAWALAGSTFLPVFL